MATSAAAVGWALIVVLIATALFRWPVEAGRAADATVTSTLGAVVSELDGNGSGIDPGTAVASSVNESILYRAWLAGTFGSPDSRTAKKYGPDMFRATPSRGTKPLSSSTIPRPAAPSSRRSRGHGPNSLSRSRKRILKPMNT